MYFLGGHGSPKVTTPLIEFIKKKREEKKAVLQVSNGDLQKSEDTFTYIEEFSSWKVVEIRVPKENQQPAASYMTKVCHNMMSLIRIGT